MSESKCTQCQRTEEEVVLRRCKICRKHFCEDHAVHKSGVGFCSLGCAEYFFHAEPEDEDD